MHTWTLGKQSNKGILGKLTRQFSAILSAHAAKSMHFYSSALARYFAATLAYTRRVYVIVAHSSSLFMARIYASMQWYAGQCAYITSSVMFSRSIQLYSSHWRARVFECTVLLGRVCVCVKIGSVWRQQRKAHYARVKIAMTVRAAHCDWLCIRLTSLGGFTRLAFMNEPPLHI